MTVRRYPRSPQGGRGIFVVTKRGKGFQRLSVFQDFDKNHKVPQRTAEDGYVLLVQDRLNWVKVGVFRTWELAWKYAATEFASRPV